MHLSKQDCFGEGMTVTNTANTAKASTNVLDFNRHGDDILGKLSLVVQCTKAGTGETASLTISWQTCAAEGFGSGVKTYNLTPVALGADDLAKGAFVVRNLPVPRDLRRFNRLVFVNGESEEFETGPVVNGFLVDGRDEPLD